MKHEVFISRLSLAYLEEHLSLFKNYWGYLSYQARNKSRNMQEVALCDKVPITRLSLIFRTTHYKFKDIFQQR